MGLGILRILEMNIVQDYKSLIIEFGNMFVNRNDIARNRGKMRFSSYTLYWLH